MDAYELTAQVDIAPYPLRGRWRWSLWLRAGERSVLVARGIEETEDDAGQAAMLAREEIWEDLVR